jgi:hypothetical protein
VETELKKVPESKNMCTTSEGTASDLLWLSLADIETENLELTFFVLLQDMETCDKKDNYQSVREIHKIIPMQK